MTFNCKVTLLEFHSLIHTRLVKVHDDESHGLRCLHEQYIPIN